MPIRRLEDTFTGTSATIGADELTSTALASVEHVKPHIQPGTLYPAVANIMLDGSTALSASTVGPNSSTVTSSKYGTVQSDGRMYYYTDIKGSKPIKDPRIGAHFGSQRHTISSIQLLDQETATHGKNVYSIDGREWMRLSASASDDETGIENGSHGVRLDMRDNDYIEVVGYFNAANLSQYAHSAYDTFTAQIDGGTAQTTDNTITQNSALRGRFISAGSFFKIPFHSSASITTTNIHTLRIEATSETYWHAIELIAQDATSATTKSQIQIPSQNVVSYGKKFTVSGTPHYNPFAFKTDGTTAWASGAHNGTAWPVGTGSSANIDTATSLGLSAWISTNYYKPYNGGRIVWWVDSSGTLKCSVNMMPPNARNLSTTASNEKGDDSAGTTSAAVANNTYLTTFTDIAIDHSQAEVAKFFNWREFGNGAGNTGTGGANFADFSMLNGDDEVAYVMDDGLTSLTSDGASTQKDTGGVTDPRLQDMLPTNASESSWFTFIGTGVSMQTTQYHQLNRTIAQNLPYGTHILKVERKSSGTNSGFKIDGIALTDQADSGYGSYHGFGIHQPKRPPIPENAVVLADYMLMADFVAQPASGALDNQFAKGVRSASSSRDSFWDSGSSMTAGPIVSPTYTFGHQPSYNSATHSTTYNGFFADNVVVQVYNQGVAHTLDVDSSTNVAKVQVDAESHKGDKFNYNGSALALGVHSAKINHPSGGYPSSSHIEVPTPIHTSSHYQTFETPYLKELVGGDRNMEQTNLVVTADGKTWDEVTRDTSYIGPVCISATTDTDTVWANIIIHDEWRGVSFNRNNLNKDFAIAYDRQICLVEGWYNVSLASRSNGEFDVVVYLNGYTGAGPELMAMYSNESNNPIFKSINVFLKRGDFLFTKGEFGVGSASHNFFEVKRI